MTYRVGNESFDTKKALKERARTIMSNYADGQKLDKPSFDFMLGLLQNHPNSEEKIGTGVDCIFVKRNLFYGTRGFYIRRNDGTETDFSFRECISPSSHYQKVKRAFRVAVEPLTMKFKSEFFDACGGRSFCEFTGEEITFLGSHTDHVPPLTFDFLLEQFVKEQGILIEKVRLKKAVDNSIRNELEDEHLIRVWINWHTTHAKLRVISKKANLEIVPFLLKDA